MSLQKIVNPTRYLRLQFNNHQLCISKRMIMRFHNLQNTKPIYQDISTSFHDSSAAREFLLRLDSKSLEYLKDEISLCILSVC